MSKRFADLIKYVFVRGLSSIVTISIFGLFARRLIHHDLENVLSFSLVFGFFVALTRTLPSFSAKIQPSHSSEERLSAVLVGYKSVLLAQMLLTPVFLSLAFGITTNPMVSLLAALILFVVSFDIDLSRAANAQEMLFPPLFLLGSLVALAFFGLHPSPNQDTAFAATLIQWVPVALYSGFRLVGLGLNRIGRAPISLAQVFLTLLIVSFDGFILNLPMMPFIPTSAATRIEIAVLIRNFISSLFLLPFLIFLTNKVKLQDGDRRARHQKWIFFVGIFGSSILAFFIYIAYFGLISGKSLAQSSSLTVGPLALGFALYYANARFFKSGRQTGLPLVAVMFLIAIVTTAILYFTNLGASQVLLVQACSFIAMTAAFVAIDRLNDHRGTHS